jgi:hypothetical protein
MTTSKPSRLEDGRPVPLGSQMISEVPVLFEAACERKRQVALCPPEVRREMSEDPMSPLDPVTRNLMAMPPVLERCRAMLPQFGRDLSWAQL